LVAVLEICTGARIRQHHRSDRRAVSARIDDPLVAVLEIGVSTRGLHSPTASRLSSAGRRIANACATCRGDRSTSASGTSSAGRAA